MHKRRCRLNDQVAGSPVSVFAFEVVNHLTHAVGDPCRPRSDGTRRCRSHWQIALSPRTDAEPDAASSAYGKWPYTSVGSTPAQSSRSRRSRDPLRHHVLASQPRSLGSSPNLRGYLRILCLQCDRWARRSPYFSESPRSSFIRVILLYLWRLSSVISAGSMGVHSSSALPDPPTLGGVLRGGGFGGEDHFWPSSRRRRTRGMAARAILINCAIGRGA